MLPRWFPPLEALSTYHKQSRMTRGERVMVTLQEIPSFSPDFPATLTLLSVENLRFSKGDEESLYSGASTVLFTSTAGLFNGAACYDACALHCPGKWGT